DSVDVTVITRDVFSLGGDLGGSFPTSTEVSIYDANFIGRGQRLEYVSLFDCNRDPRYGYAFVYRKSSLFGPLANAEVAYSLLNSRPNNCDETEFSYYFRLTRTLVSPYKQFAGVLEVSRDW